MIMTKVKVDIGGEDIITVIVTDAALKELGAKVGEELEVLTTTGIMRLPEFCTNFSQRETQRIFCRRR